MQLDAQWSAEGQEGFGSLLRRSRALAGLSQEALAERAGISRRAIADLERGARRFPYPDTASRLATALELGVAERAAFMAACRPRRTGSTRRYTLQIEPSTFVGRERELAEISQLVAGSRVLTLTGTGGIGKTRIALELAHQLEPEYADGAVFIDLAPVHDASLLPQAVAATLGVSAKPGESVTDSLRQHFQAGRVLLVLDNCEHVVTACAQLVDVLIRASSSLQLVITSREPLRIHGERCLARPGRQSSNPSSIACCVVLVTRLATPRSTPPGSWPGPADPRGRRPGRREPDDACADPLALNPNAYKVRTTRS